MRVAFVFNHSYRLGGGEVSLLDLIRSLNKNRFFPIAFLPAGGDIRESLKSHGIHAVVSPLPPLRSILLWRPLSALGQLISTLRLSKPAIIHANGSRACLYCVLAGRILGIPVLWHVRETIKDLFLYDRFLFSLSTAVVCVSESVKIKRFGSFPEKSKTKLYVVHNGVDTSIFRRNLAIREKIRKDLRIKDNEILFGVVANYIPLKGQDFFLKGVAALKKSDPALSFKVLLIGRPLDRAFYDLLRRLTVDMGINDAVIFREHTYRIAEIYPALDIFVLSSKREGFSRSLLEAMSTGFPVIATRLTEIEEAVVDGENGYLVKYDDVQGLAQAALKLAKDKGLCEVMGALNRKKVEQEFSLISHARSIESVYSRILSDPFCKAR